MPRLNDLTSVVLGSSRSSFIHTICKFVRDVDEMNDTVLVPSMLTDLNKCSSAQVSSSSSPDLSDCFDLQTLHQLLNRLKDELTIARFDDDNSNSSSANILSSAINCNSPTTTTSTITTTPSSSNVNNTNQITSSSSSCSLRIAEGDLTGLSKKLHSCKCSGSSSDDGFSSLNSYSRNSDDESTSSSPASDSDSECCSSSSTPNQSRENDSSSAAESSPEYIVNLLRLHIQGIQSILTRFSKYTDHVSDSYVNSLN